MRWPGLPAVGPHRRLCAAFAADALGTGLFLPFSILLFTATTAMDLPTIGLALSVAALVRIPATAGAGALLDRIGPTRCVLLSNLLQAAGFAGYLAVATFPQLVAAAVVVQLGNSLFWVAFPALVGQVAAAGEQERWFGLVNGLRAAGLGLGALVAGAAVSAGGVTGYRVLVAANALSYLVAAALVLADPAPARTTPDPGAPLARWSGVLRDRTFLEFVAVCLGLTLLSLAFAVAVPVYLTRTLGLPAWTPGVLLALNAGVGAVGAAPVVAAITGRRRDRVLVASQLLIGCAYLLLLAMGSAGARGSLVLGVLAALAVTVGELVQGPTVSAVVNEAAPDHERGRYIAVYQMTFSIVDVVAPGLLTWCLARGPLATWLPLVAVAALDAVALLLLAPRLPALRRRVGRRDPLPDTRALEADAL